MDPARVDRGLKGRAVGKVIHTEGGVDESDEQ